MDRFLKYPGVYRNLLGIYGTATTRVEESKRLFTTIRNRDVNGFSPLHAAAEFGYYEICSYILDQKVDVDLKMFAPNNQGATPLHIASQYGDWKTVELLLNRGAKVQARRNDGFTPLHGAVAAGKEENVRLLLSRGADVNTHGSPLIKAMVNKRYKIVEILLNYGANPNYCPYNRYTPLIWCICKNDARSLSLLLEANANPNYGGPSTLPLLVARELNRTDMIQPLIEAGADTDVKAKGELREHKYCTELAAILGMKALHAKKYGVALYYFSVAIAEDPDEYEWVSCRSICWSHLQNGVAALRDAETLIQRFPKRARGHRRVGDAWYTMRDYGKAANAYAEALRLDHDHTEKNLLSLYEKAKTQQNSKK